MLQRLLTKERESAWCLRETKRGTERIAESLNRRGFSAAMIHGDRSQSQRTAALTGFQQGRFRVLVATDLASRGIHVQDIAHVINYDLPEVAENFIQPRWANPDATADTACFHALRERATLPNSSNWNARSASRWSGCARMIRLGFRKNRKDCGQSASRGVPSEAREICPPGRSFPVAV